MACSKPSREFSNLPSELRLRIWQAALPDVDGVALHVYKKGFWELRDPVPEDFSGEVPEPLARADVILDFNCDKLDEVHIDLPMAFVNHEARATALAWAQARDIKLKFDADKAYHVAVLAFNPQRDALLLNFTRIFEFGLEPLSCLFNIKSLDLHVYSDPRIVQIALPHTVLSSAAMIFFDVLQRLPRLQVVYVIVDAEKAMGLPEDAWAEDHMEAEKRMKHQHWRTSLEEGDSYIWLRDEGRFSRNTGAPIGPESMHTDIEKNLLESMTQTFGANVERFEVRIVEMEMQL